MNIKHLIIIFLSLFFVINANAQTKNKPKVQTPKWIWADSLDAVKAAPENHKIVYEDSKVRILKVVSPPYSVEPLHTHKYPSTMWATKGGHVIYYAYALNSKRKIVKIDSVDIKNMPLNMGGPVEPEPPHSVKNMSADTLIGYRVEYKKRFIK